MPTERQKRAAAITIENPRNPMGKNLREAGYSEAIATHPKEVTESDGWKEIMKVVHFMIYNCPSATERGENREYTKGVPPLETVAAAMSWGMSSDDHVLKPEEFMKLIPLENEA